MTKLTHDLIEKALIEQENELARLCAGPLSDRASDSIRKACNELWALGALSRALDGVANGKDRCVAEAFARQGEAK